MKAGIASLVAAYVLSQFYRAFLAVLSPVLLADLGATPDDLATASGVWFLAFAACQIPVGSALDRIGPRRTAAVLLAVGAAGAGVFALATGPDAITLAMALIGIGCSPVLMASYYIFARHYSPAIFGTLAGAVIGIGSLGNIAASLPLSAAVTAFGWRETVWGLAAITLLAALGIAVFVRDPARVGARGKGSIFDLLRMPALWPILIMMAVCYAPTASLRGLWVGPYYADVFGADATAIGNVTLIMGLAMVAGSFALGPAERRLKSRKGLILAANLFCLAAILALWLWPTAGGWVTVALLAMAGFFGSTFPMVIAHGRAFIPPHLLGRGVTLLNFFGIASVGLLQFATGRLHAATVKLPPEAPYAAIFLFLAVGLAAGLSLYAFSRDRTD
jgi:predicted MFS family arabinose efflux permease